MKYKRILITVFFLIIFCLVGCNEKVTTVSENKVHSETTSKTTSTANQEESTNNKTIIDEYMIYIIVGDNTLTAKLENNDSCKELVALLNNGPVTMKAENYGGFEKVCDLGQSLSSNDEQMTAKPGDIMLYNSKNVVIFYGENSWAYTKLGTVIDEDLYKLSDILGGNETSVTLKLIE